MVNAWTEILNWKYLNDGNFYDATEVIKKKKTNSQSTFLYDQINFVWTFGYANIFGNCPRDLMFPLTFKTSNFHLLNTKKLISKEKSISISRFSINVAWKVFSFFTSLTNCECETERNELQFLHVCKDTRELHNILNAVIQF